ncbi:hypothetical protein [Gordonia oryzae]|uniref:hypothetical protein n=1 Tax=Gordonia oryzae TaxID=2487349 RepID=UPI001FE8452E|nr:hypothetical protein [Gordonia oryzae]
MADGVLLLLQLIGGRVLDLCVGSCVVARAAAQSGAAAVTAADALDFVVHHRR